MSEPIQTAPSAPDQAVPTRPVRQGDHVFLVDGSSYIFRAYHALPPLTRKSDGLPVGAVAGFCNMLWKLLKEANEVGVKPTHLAVVLDHSAATFRNQIYDLYKAQRPEPPEDLRPQFGMIRKAVHAFNVACIEQKGFEADDLIATYARLAVEAGADVTIVASDKDLMQLIGPGVLMLDTMKGKTIGREEVFEKFGVTPDKVVDIQALAGDSVDNVPGVPGIGIKTAAQLIDEYGDLETLLARAGEIKQPKRREALINFAEQARISMRLVTLDRNVPLNEPIDRLGVRSIDGVRLIRFLKALEFSTLTGRVAAATGVESSAVAPDPEIASAATAGAAAPALDFGPAAASGEVGAPPSSDAAQSPREPDPAGLAPSQLVHARLNEARAHPIDRARYETVVSADRLRDWMERAAEIGVVAVDTETTSLDPMQADLVGVSLALAPDEACYIPLAHRGAGDGLFTEGLLPGQIPINEALAILKPVLEDPAILKIAQNLKYDWLILARYGIEVAPFDDTMLISYVLDAGRGTHGMDPLSEKWLGHTPIKFDDVTGKGKARITFDRVAIDKATAYAAEDADVTLRLWRALKPRLAAEGMTTVYETLERPMVPVLASMERRGISIDRSILSRLSGEFAQSAAALEAEIQELAGQPFNVGSPKQLGDILFGVLGMPGATKTATGAWATGASILEDLAEQGYELPQKILDWRQLTKLRSTYTDALPSYQHPETKRVHTSYALAATTTGRLSSSEPNLQNIPVRTEAGRKIRKAFIADPGYKLVSADYSQIELRLLAEIANIPALRNAFREGLDIHALTASEMFGVPVEGMPSEVRRRAKAINFGIIYGISAFGLANQLGIGREEAGAYIKRYFERFPGIRDYMEETKRICRDKGYVTTLFGRRCHYPEITSKNASIRSFNERAAINARLQGTAADIIRRAMIRVASKLDEAKLSARMLLQVHDELIFEVPDEEVDATLKLVAEVMERAPEPAVQLAVPLRVDARAADNWDEAH
ncbi:DNA polymerase I [Kaistia dalseonensis]|uniref:DNA polymerase I n=1 Tax=Kaistia dalseonensis TaxID=410840 RepID=A0ABU0H419_9HYPH|nr:DNA polymerase I [Kaistia dalseonensis]MCX5494188.1 DNA polymerase I [Kaistia dalseonensis]MDQ0436767.1 DNA polymerase-1 [Kaistia dalseonensis]